MARIIRVSVGRQVSVLIDLLRLEEVVGERSGEILKQLIDKIRNDCFLKFGFQPIVEEGLTYVKIYGYNIPPRAFGFIEREADNIESRLLSRMGKSFHSISILRSANPLDRFRIALYKMMSSASRSMLYRLTDNAARKLGMATGLEAAQYKGGVVGLVLVGDVEPVGDFKIDLDEGAFAFVLDNVKIVDFNDFRDREFVKKILNSKARRKLRAANFIVDDYRAFYDYSIIPGKPVIVRKGVEFRSVVWNDGYVGYAIAPCLSVEARGTLADDPSQAIVNCRVRRLSDGLSGFLVSYGDECVVSFGGVEARVDPGDLARIYDMSDLERMGIVGDALKMVRRMQAGWRFYMEFSRIVSGFEIAGQKVVLEDYMERIEV
ncbi:MAG: hypothetical protein DRZ80_04600 [Thermoprotei archaeon]|nr:MAG: hypothetical protein DRZ80_04600 [Thermoprotei archaeon]